MENKIKVIIIISILAVIAAGFYIYTNQPQTLVVEKKDLQSSQLPSGFPSTFPVEMGSRVLENFEASTQDGRKQYTRTVTTNKSAEERVKDFRLYFLDLGWIEIETSKPDANTISTLLRKGDDTVLITSYEDSKKKQKTVSVTLTEAAKQP